MLFISLFDNYPWYCVNFVPILYGSLEFDFGVASFMLLIVKRKQCGEKVSFFQLLVSKSLLLINIGGMTNCYVSINNYTEWCIISLIIVFVMNSLHFALEPELHE